MKITDEGGLKMKLLMWDNSIHVFWSLPQVPAQNSYNSCKLLCHAITRSTFCSNEVSLLRKRLLSTGLLSRASHRKTKLWLEAWNFQPHPHSQFLQRVGRNWKWRQWSIMPMKLLAMGFWQLPGGWRDSHTRMVMQPKSMGTSSCTLYPPRLLCISIPGSSSVLLLFSC